MNRLITISFLLLTAGTIFTNSTRFTDSGILPKWLWAGFGVSLLLGCVAIWCLKKDRRTWNGRYAIAGTGVLCAGTGIYGILQYLDLTDSLSAYCRVTGSFDNPAGLAACLTAGMPFLIYGIHAYKKRVVKGEFGALAVFSVVAVCLSGSRSGMVSLLVLLLAYFYPYYKGWFRKKRWGIILLSGVVLIALGVTGYLMKKDSADGRMLIWKCAWQMIADKPLTGHGLHGVEAKYMDYQAQYFATHPDSEFADLAGNVKQVFNEYLALGVCFGVISWMVLTGIITGLLWCYRKHPSKEGKTGLLSLLGIGVFSVFSYPFAYPCIWIIALFCVFLIVRPTLPKGSFQKLQARTITCLLCMTVSCLLTVYTVKRTANEWKWQKTAQASIYGNAQALNEYRKLYPPLYDNPYFLYNYAAELHADRQYARSQAIAQRCATYWADYDLELLRGENLCKLERYREAEPHFRLASRMCPSHFVPLYRLYQLYKRQGMTKEAKEMGEHILNKPVKIDSDLIRAIRKEVQKDLVQDSK